jgi:hypothetical protein
LRTRARKTPLSIDIPPPEFSQDSDDIQTNVLGYESARTPDGSKIAWIQFDPEANSEGYHKLAGLIVSDINSISPSGIDYGEPYVYLNPGDFDNEFYRFEYDWYGNSDLISHIGD